MDLILLLCFIIIFSGTVVLSVILFYFDIQMRERTRPNEPWVYSYVWERRVAVVFGLLQVGLSSFGIFGAIRARFYDSQINWLDTVALCNLQLLAGTNTARTLRVLQFSPWAIWATYLFTTISAPDIAPSIVNGRARLFAVSALLSRLAMGSLLASTASYIQFVNCKRLISRQLDPREYSTVRRQELSIRKFLLWLVVPNAVVTSSQLAGAVVLYSLAYCNQSIALTTHQYIFLSCTALQLLCSFAIALRVIKHVYNLTITAVQSATHRRWAGRSVLQEVESMENLSSIELSTMN